MISFKSIHDRLFSGNAKEALSDIFDRYESSHWGVVNFFYFANAHFQNLYTPKKRSEKSERYFQALLDGDCILPDGVALSLIHYKYLHPEVSGWKILAHYPQYAKEALSNLNGTDFVPKLLKDAIRRYGVQDVELYLYGAFPETIPRSGQYVVENFGIIPELQHGYAPFDWTSIEAGAYIPGRIRILLIGQGSPRQELFVADNKDRLQKHGILAVTVGGLFDFWGGYEKRAPLWVQRIRGEWIWRLISNPKKNFRKVMASFWSFRYLFFGVR